MTVMDDSIIWLKKRNVENLTNIRLLLILHPGDLIREPDSLGSDRIHMKTERTRPEYIGFQATNRLTES